MMMLLRNKWWIFGILLADAITTSAGCQYRGLTPFEPRELVARMQTILRRVNHQESLSIVTTSRLRSGRLVIDLKRRAVELDNNLLDLTTMEFEILALFFNHPAELLTRNDMMDRLRGID